MLSLFSEKEVIGSCAFCIIIRSGNKELLVKLVQILALVKSVLLNLLITYLWSRGRLKGVLVVAEKIEHNKRLELV